MLLKKFSKQIIFVVFILAVIASFFIGRAIKEQEYMTVRMERCNTLISLAIDKAENENLSDRETMAALISNIYAAYEYCDVPHLSEQLHDLWNTLIFEDDIYVGSEDALTTELKNIAEMLRTAA